MNKEIKVIKMVSWIESKKSKYRDIHNVSESKREEFEKALINYCIEKKIKITGDTY